MYKGMIALGLTLSVVLVVAGCSQRHVATTPTGQTVYGEKAEVSQRLQAAADSVQQLMNAPDSAIPEAVLKDAKCVAIVPDMVKGGFVVGGQHGRGVATCRTNNGWSNPAFFVITGGSFGPQIGLQAVDLTMLVMTDDGMQKLLSSQFKLGADASVAAGPVGRQAEASTDWKMKSGVLVYSRARGLFAGLNLNGAVVKSDMDSTVAFYGKPLDFNTVLSGKMARDANAQPFISSVRTAFREAKASGG